MTIPSTLSYSVVGIVGVWAGVGRCVGRYADVWAELEMCVRHVWAKSRDSHIGLNGGLPWGGRSMEIDQICHGNDQHVFKDSRIFPRC